MLAAPTGGLSLVFGMTLLTGVFQAAFSRVLHRARALLPPEVTGVIVTMVGLSLVGPGVGNLSGVFTVWGKGPLRLYSVLVGILAGYVLAYFSVVARAYSRASRQVYLFCWSRRRMG